MCSRREERDQLAVEKDQLEEVLLSIRGEADEAKLQAQETIQNLKVDIKAGNIVETPFWKDRYVKLAWLANQALIDIPKNLRAAEGMVDPMKTPKEILGFLELCRKMYDNLKAMSAPP
ncbi:hypothetical protein CR513_57703, partial [Mucuna pruriens]